MVQFPTENSANVPCHSLVNRELSGPLWGLTVYNSLKMLLPHDNQKFPMSFQETTMYSTVKGLKKYFMNLSSGWKQVFISWALPVRCMSIVLPWNRLFV